MPLTTQRLDLSEIALNDIEAIHKLHSLPEVDEFNTLGIPTSINETEQVLNTWLKSMNDTQPKERFIFTIILRQTKEFIGLFGIVHGKTGYRSAEIWYKMHPKFWNKGYATEATKEVLRFCFTDLKLHRIEAGCAVANIGSIKVLEKAGFIREGQKRKKLPIRGKWVDNYFYAILEEDHK